MGLFSKIFRGKKASVVSDRELIEPDALIVDVREPSEFVAGHLEGSINVPLRLIPAEVDKLKKTKKQIVTCCLSGKRSAKAYGILKEMGIESLVDGGSWKKLKQNS